MGEVGIVGSGRMAQALGKALRDHGIAIEAIAGRDAARTTEAAAFIGCAGTSPEHLAQSTQQILIAVSDDAIAPLAEQLAGHGFRGTALHTCGAHGPDVLSPLRAAGCSVGVMHPLVGVPSAERGVIAMPGATFACAGDAVAHQWALELVASLNGRTLRIDPRNWHLYHAAAAIAGNYQCTLADVALELLRHAGVPGEEALPAFAAFLRATTANILSVGPVEALPGPISRGDTGTIRRHVAALTELGSSETNLLYAAAGLRTIDVARRKGTLSDEAAAEIRSILKQLLHENP